MSSELQGKVLVVDDSPAIHDDYRKVLSNLTQTRQVQDIAAKFLGKAQAAMQASPVARSNSVCPDEFELQSAYQGDEAIEMVELVGAGYFDLAFVDMRMPPGKDGIDTILGLWQIDPELPCVICTAYSDYSWRDIRDRLPRHDQFMILKKPFEAIEIRQLATALTGRKLNEKKLRGQLAALQAKLVSAAEGRTAPTDSNDLLALSQKLLVPLSEFLNTAQKIDLAENLGCSEQSNQSALFQQFCRDGHQLRELIEQLHAVTNQAT